MEKNIRISHQYFLLGFGLVSLVVFTLLLCALSFVRGYPLSVWQFPLAILITLVSQYFACEYLYGKKSKSIFFKTGGILLAICLISLILANAIYDLSFDGQWYHQETVGQIKNGFNPYYKTLPSPDVESSGGTKEVWCSGPDRTENDSMAGSPAVNLMDLDINHMPKAAEIVEAAIFRLTNRIETGKAVNLIILAGSFFLCLSLVYKIDRFSTGIKWLTAALVCFNPITITQLSSYCVDGLMASLLVCQLLLFCFLFLENNKYYRFLLGLLIMISVNIKYTSLVYTAIFCTGFLLLLLVGKKWAYTKNSFYTCALSASLGLLFIGFHPYVTNLIATNQLFYGLPETRNEIYDITPSLIRGKNRFDKLFLSLATHSEEDAADKAAVKEMLKIPFSVNKKELLNANNPELKFAAFGPFFGGALLVSILLLLVTAFRSYRHPVFGYTLASLGIILLTVLIIPDPWWARFVPQLWLFPVIILLMAELLPASRIRPVKTLLYASLALNVAWVLCGIFFNIMVSSHINYQLAQLKALSQTISVEYCAYRPFTSNRERFIENHIPFIEKKVEGQYIYNVIHSNTRFETTTELPNLPKPFLMRLNEKWKETDGDKKNN